MASRGLRSSLPVVFFAFVFFSSGFYVGAFGQEPGGKATNSSHQENDGNRPYRRDNLNWNWNQRGRTVPGGESAAELRFRAYRQKMAMRAQRMAAPPPALSSAHPPKQSLGGASASLSGSTVWVPLGPAPLASDATGNGMQNYNWISGRATSVLIDPADSTGNTVLLGGAYGGLWKSTNAGSRSPDPNPGPAGVVWQPLIDDQPTLAVGAIALQPGNSDMILVGTGAVSYTHLPPRLLRIPLRFCHLSGALRACRSPIPGLPLRDVYKRQEELDPGLFRKSGPVPEEKEARMEQFVDLLRRAIGSEKAQVAGHKA